MRLKSLRDLYLSELDDLHSAETQLIRCFPRIIDAVTNPQLRSALQIHLEETRQHLARLQQLLGRAGYTPGREHCNGVEGLLREAFELLENPADLEVRDAGLIAAAQKIDHYEISGYGTARTYAEILNDNEAAHLLQQTLNEERQSDEKLNQIAHQGINLEAAESQRP